MKQGDEANKHKTNRQTPLNFRQDITKERKTRQRMCEPTRPSRTNTPKYVLFIIGDWNAKVGSQETPGVTDKFGLGMRNEAG